jgi:hypothetical protein
MREDGGEYIPLGELGKGVGGERNTASANFHVEEIMITYTISSNPSRQPCLAK